MLAISLVCCFLLIWCLSLSSWVCHTLPPGSWGLSFPDSCVCWSISFVFCGFGFFFFISLWSLEHPFGIYLMTGSKGPWACPSQTGVAGLGGGTVWWLGPFLGSPHPLGCSPHGSCLWHALGVAAITWQVWVLAYKQYCSAPGEVLAEKASCSVPLWASFWGLCTDRMSVCSAMNPHHLLKWKWTNFTTSGIRH